MGLFLEKSFSQAKFFPFDMNVYSFLIACLLSLLAGSMVWHFGGIWYKFRLKLAGAKDLDTSKIKKAHLLACFVFAFPALLVCIPLTIKYKNFNSLNDELTSTIILLLYSIFYFWSILNSYKLSKQFSPKPVRALVLFFSHSIIPICIGILSFMQLFVI